MGGPHSFVVTGRSGASTFTYNCPTAEWALRKLKDFRAAGRADISVTTADGQAVTEADLMRLSGQSEAPAPDGASLLSSPAERLVSS